MGTPKKYKYGAVSVDLWTNTSDKGEYHTVSIQRGYTKDDGKTWENTNSLRTNDIPKAILGLTKAYEEIVSKKNEQTKTE